jgi:PAS domain S-box-containing protein
MELRHSGILNQLAEGVIVADADGRLTFVNEAAERIHGVNRLDIEPDQYSATYHLFTEAGDPYPPNELPLTRAVRGERVEEARWRVRRPDGTELLVIGSARPLFGDNGAQLGAVLTLRDDSARDAAEREVRESEARLRALTDNLPGSVVYQLRTDSQGRSRQFLYVSQAHEEMTGVTAEAVLADATLPYRMVHPDDQARMFEAGAAAIAQRAPYDLEVRYVKIDGEVRWSRMISAPREQPDGSLIWDGLQIDVTDRVMAQLELEELNKTLEKRIREAVAQHQVLADVVESTDAFIGVLGLDFEILAINRANIDEFERVYGVRPAAGDNMLELLADQPEHQQQVREFWSRALAGEEYSFEAEFGSAERATYQIKFNVLRDAEGKQFGAFNIVTDVTQQRLDRERLAEAEERIQQAQKIEAIGQLTGGVAHDFNNLLMVISSGLDLLERQTDQGRRDRIRGAMRNAIDRGSTLSRQLLAFSRRQPLKPVAVSLPHQINGMRELLDGSLRGDVHVRTEFPEDLWSVEVDPGELELVILNLAVNARDAMPNGGTITIRGENLVDQSDPEISGDIVRLSVIDTGTGMSPGVVAKAFEPFFTTKEIGQGSGLGLPQAYGFAQESGGVIRIASEADKGTTIALLLPRSFAEPRPISTLLPAATTQSVESPGTVLVVEDDREVAAMVTEMLDQLGYRAFCVTDSTAALGALADGRSIDLVLSDIMMAGELNGVELAQEIRKRRPDIPILLNSGFSGAAETDAQAMQLEILRKPFTVQALASAISGALSMNEVKFG